jgi:methionyl aminopeptidase
VQRLLDVTQSALHLATRLIGEKRRWSEVAREIETYVNDEGFSVVETMVGHGIGRELHEEPVVPNFVSESFLKDGDFDLRPGLVIAVEPMVNLGGKDVKVRRDHWTQVTADGKPSAHFEHTIAITKDGPIRLTAAPGEERLP